MKHTANTTIIESPLKNGGVEFKVEYKNNFYSYCRTEKKAKEIAEKAERFNGQHYATHYERKRGFLICNTRGQQTITTDLKQVTCPRCVSKLNSMGLI